MNLYNVITEEYKNKLAKQIADLIDEIASYKPLYSTRKKIEQDPNFAIEQVKNVAIWSIQKHLGDNNASTNRCCSTCSCKSSSKTTS
jgi:hypothetical protein